MDYRILLPLRVMLVPVNAAALLAAVGPMFRWRPVFGLAYAGLIALQVSMVPAWAKEAPNSGLGFNSEIWRKSPAINSVLSAPPGAIVYCNVADAAWLITDRFCKPYPPIYNNTTAKPNPHAYYKKLPGIWKDLHDTDGRVVYYRHNRRKQQVGLERLVKDLQLVEVEHFKDGSIWKLDPAYSGPSLKWVEAEIKRQIRAEKLAKQKQQEEHAKKTWHDAAGRRTAAAIGAAETPSGRSRDASCDDHRSGESSVVLSVDLSDWRASLRDAASLRSRRTASRSDALQVNPFRRGTPASFSSTPRVLPDGPCGNCCRTARRVSRGCRRAT